MFYTSFEGIGKVHAKSSQPSKDGSKTYHYCELQLLGVTARLQLTAEQYAGVQEKQVVKVKGEFAAGYEGKLALAVETIVPHQEAPRLRAA